MKYSTFKYGFLVVLLLLGMMVGISIAEKGMFSVSGIPESESESFQVNQSEDKVEVVVLGETFDADLPIQSKDAEVASTNQEKKEAKENNKDNIDIKETDNKEVLNNEENNEIVNNNVISKTGNRIGNFLEVSTEKGLNAISKLIID